MASFHLAAAQKGALLIWTAQFEAEAGLEYAHSTKADLQYAHSTKADLKHAHRIPCHACEGALHDPFHTVIYELQCPGIHATIEISKDGCARLH